MSITTKIALQSHIRSLYIHKHPLLVHDRTPFSMSIDEWKNKTSYIMEKLLAHNTPHTKNLLKIAKEQLKKNTTDIYKFITSKPISKPKKIKPIRKRHKKPHNEETLSCTPNPQETQTIHPKHYKKSTLLAYVNTFTKPWKAIETNPYN